MPLAIPVVSGQLILEDKWVPVLQNAAAQTRLFQQQTASLGAPIASNLNNATVSAQKFQTALINTSMTAGRALSYGLTAPLVLAAGGIIKLGIDAVEAENLVTVSFGDMKQAAMEWSQSLSANLGLNQYEMRQTAGTLFNMTTSLGIARDEAFKMSTGVAMLAADMASFRNIPMEQALIKIRAGLVGETEPLKAIGILVHDAVIKHEALRIGMIKQGEVMTQQQKVMARWSAILRQTSNDQGDLARTLQSPANQLRIMRERILEAGTALGVSLLPIIQQFIGMLVTGSQKLIGFMDWFSKLPPLAQKVGIGFAAMTAAAGPMLFMFGSIASAVRGMIPLFAPGLSTAATTASTALGMSGLAGASRTLLTTLAGPVGLVAVLGGLAAVWTGMKVSDINARAEAMRNAADIMQRINEGKNIPTPGQQAPKPGQLFPSSQMSIDDQLAGISKSYEAGAKGARLQARATLDMAAAAMRAQEETGKLAKVEFDALIPSMVTAAEKAETYVQQVSRHKKEVEALTKAQKDEILAAQQLGQGPLDEVMKKYGLTDSHLKILTGTMKENKKEMNEAERAAERYRKEIDDLVDKLGGGGIRGEATKLNEALRLLGGAHKLTSEGAGQANKILEEALETYRSLGQNAPKWMIDTWYATIPPPTVLTGLENLNWELQHTKELFLEMGPLAKTGLGGLSLPGGMDIGKLTGGLKIPGIFEGFGKFIREDLGKVLGAALAGGGKPAEAAGGAIGGFLGQSILGKTAGWLTSNFGKTLGGALGSIIPGLGTMLGAFGGDIAQKLFGKIGGFFAGLFDGKSDARKAVESWVNSTFGSFNELQDELAKLDMAQADKLWRDLTQRVKTTEDAERAKQAIIAALEEEKNKAKEVGEAYDDMYDGISEDSVANTEERMAQIAEEKAKLEEELKDALRRLHDVPLDPLNIPYRYTLVGNLPAGISDVGTSEITAAIPSTLTANFNVDGRTFATATTPALAEYMELNGVSAA